VHSAYVEPNADECQPLYDGTNGVGADGGHTMMMMAKFKQGGTHHAASPHAASPLSPFETAEGTPVAQGGDTPSPPSSPDGEGDQEGQGAGAGAVEEEEEEGDNAVAGGASDDFTFAAAHGITSDVPRLSNLTADDEDEDADDAAAAAAGADESGAAVSPHTTTATGSDMSWDVAGTANPAAAATGQVTAPAPDQGVNTAANAAAADAAADQLIAAAAASPLPDSPTFIAAASANVTAAAAAASSPTFISTAAASQLPLPAVSSPTFISAASAAGTGVIDTDAEHTEAMDICYTQMLPAGFHATVDNGDNGATETGTMAFDGDAPTTGSGFGFTDLLEGGAVSHAAW